MDANQRKKYEEYINKLRGQREKCRALRKALMSDNGLMERYGVGLKDLSDELDTEMSRALLYLDDQNHKPVPPGEVDVPATERGNAFHDKT